VVTLCSGSSRVEPSAAAELSLPLSGALDDAPVPPGCPGAPVQPTNRTLEQIARSPAENLDCSNKACSHHVIALRPSEHHLCSPHNVSSIFDMCMQTIIIAAAFVLEMGDRPLVVALRRV
jgi:hypothetical protein